MENAEQVQDRLAEYGGVELSPQDLMADFQRLAQLKSQVRDLPSTALTLGQEADALIFGDDGQPLYERFEDMPEDNVKLFVMKSIESGIASRRASSLIKEESVHEETMMTKLDVFYRGRMVRAKAITEYDIPIEAVTARGAVRKRLETVEGFIAPGDLSTNQLTLRPSLSVFRPTLTDHYRVNMVNRDAQPRVDLSFT